MNAAKEIVHSFAIGDMVTLYGRKGCLVTNAHFTDDEGLHYSVDMTSYFEHHELTLEQRATPETLAEVRRMVRANDREEFAGNDHDDTDIDNDQGSSPRLAEDVIESSGTQEDSDENRSELDFEDDDRRSSIDL